MQALNLHLEQAVAQSPSSINLQGSKTVSQDESSFLKELQSAQKAEDARKAQEMPKPTDGNQKIESSQTQKTESAEEAKTVSVENPPDTKDANAVDKSIPSGKDSTVSSVIASSVQPEEMQFFSRHVIQTQEESGSGEIGDDFFSLTSEEQTVELTSIQEEYLKQDALVQESDFISLNLETEPETIALEASDKKDLRKNSVPDSSEEDALIQSLLLGRIPVEKTHETTAVFEDKDNTKSDPAERELIGTSEDSIISVIDERTVTKEAAREGKFVSSVSYDGNGNAQMSLSLSNPDSIPLQTGNALTMTSSERFEGMLSQELQSNAKEFVKTGSVILKDNNSGTINLILHPEELGNVKIKLEVTDKVIAGKIIVSSEEAFNAFKANLDSLRQAFTDSGFQAGGFDLSWNSGGQSGSGEQDRNFKGLIYSDALPEINDDEYAMQLTRDAVIYGTSVINMIA